MSRCTCHPPGPRGAGGQTNRQGAPAAAWHPLFAAMRNAGRPGPGAMAVSAVDAVLWDLKARLLGLPLYRVLPAFHDEVPVYGSGGFTNYPLDRLARQLGDWVERGVPRVKLKTSREPGRDPERLAAVRQSIGPDAELFADANGALTRKEALYWAHRPAAEATWSTSTTMSASKNIVFDGTLSPAGGALRPAPDRPGSGLEVRVGGRRAVPGARRPQPLNDETGPSGQPRFQGSARLATKIQQVPEKSAPSIPGPPRRRP